MKISRLIEDTPEPRTVSQAICFAMSVLDAACYAYAAESRFTDRAQYHLKKSKLILYELLTEHERGTLDL